MNISKQTAVILILGIVILLLGVFMYFYFSPDSPKENPIPNTTPISTPFGDTTKTNENPTGDTTINTSTSTNVVSDNSSETLRQIFSEPVSGSIVFTKNKEVVARFVERSNGNIYEVKKDSSQVIRLTNKTIPKIQEAVWDKLGNSVILRYLNEQKQGQIDSFAGKIKLSTSTSNEFFADITGSFLPVNIEQVITNPSSGKIAYFQKKLSGDGSNIFTASSDGTNKTQIADISLSEINISWPKENVLAVLTKPSSKYAGFLYTINTQEGILRQVLGDIWGLNVLINSQVNNLILSKITRNEPMLSLYNIEKGEETNLQIKTFAEKCIWGKKDSGVIYCAVPTSLPKAEYPDNWYQGEIHFVDNIWKVDLETGMSTLLYDLVSKDLSIDATDLSISDKDDFLVFTNKTDLSLWGLILE